MENNVFTSKILDVQVSSDLAYMFMVLDYMESDFRRIMQRKYFGITQTNIVRILYNLLCSLNYMHSANVVHRDIKPANILLDQHCNVQICDFGLSRTLPGSITKHCD
jgi:mitogen-activated protein kinase 1/3